MVRAARKAGYSVGVHAVMEGVTAVGMAVPATLGRPGMAMSVSAIASRIPPARIPDLVARLTRATDAIVRITGAA